MRAATAVEEDVGRAVGVAVEGGVGRQIGGGDLGLAWQHQRETHGALASSVVQAGSCGAKNVGRRAEGGPRWLSAQRADLRAACS